MILARVRVYLIEAVMEAYSSNDFIEDALDILRSQELHFAVVIGVPGECHSRSYFSEYMEEDKLDKLADSMDGVLSEVVSEERE